MSRRQAFVEAFEQFLRTWPTRFEGPKPPARFAPKLPDAEAQAALIELLLGLRMLDALPLSYLVPDAGLLPAESIRFFHVDPVFSDRLVEGALSAARTATPDEVVLGWAERLNLVFSSLTGAISGGPPAEAKALYDYVVAWLRDAMDTEVTKAMAPEPAPPAKPLGLYELPPRIHLTGLLLRSDLVRRWPKMRVVAYSRGEGRTDADRIAVSRPYRFGSSVLLALISGVPKCVEIHEPDEGCRFGVELKTSGQFEVQALTRPGTLPELKTKVDVPARDPARRVLNIEALQQSLQKLAAPGGPPANSAWVSLALEQRPYAQVFLPDPQLAETRKVTNEDWQERRAQLISKVLGGDA